MNNFYNSGAGPESRMIVRRSPSHAVHVFIRRSVGQVGVVISRVEKSQGPLPNIDGLIGPVFHTPYAIRKALLHRMKKSLINRTNQENVR